MQDNIIEMNEIRAAGEAKWRNIWCDVHTLFVHIDNERDIFVTLNTKDFQRNHDKFARIAEFRAMTPDECLQEILSTLPPV